MDLHTVRLYFLYYFRNREYIQFLLFNYQGEKEGVVIKAPKGKRGTPRSQPTKAADMSPLAGLRAAVAGFFGLSGALTLVFVLSGRRTRVLKGGELSLEESTVISAYGAAISSSKKWSMQRTGYDPLPYFPTDGTSTDSRNYAFLDSYDGIIEPGVKNELFIHGFSTASSKYYYSYEVCNGETCSTGLLYPDTGKKASLSVGVTLSCTPHDELSVVITKLTQNGNSIKGVTSGTLKCIYVRREMHSLTSEDLSAAMDAMYTMYSISEEDGQTLYGQSFHNSTYYTKAHHFNAAWQDADHIHEGLGFLPQHMKITNMFEEAMQTVDESVAMPYWDFTMEKNITGGSPYGSIMYSEDTFGSLKLPDDETFGFTYESNKIIEAHIQDGRWKKLETEILYDTPSGYSDLIKNFGYLRAPWNLNPSPFVSRFVNYNADLPTCTEHYDFITRYDTLVEFLKIAPLTPHAKVHGAVGSVFGCDKMSPMLDAGYITSQAKQVLLCTQWPIVLKILYRKGYLSGQEIGTCERPKYSDVQDFSCPLSCNDDGSGGFEDYLVSLMSKYTGDLTSDGWTAWKDFICTGDGGKVFAGDHLEAASPADPSFWPIHPTLERLYQAKMIMGGFSDSSWPSFNDGSGNYICDRNSCSESSEEPNWGEYSACCDGHYENDKLLDFVGGERFGSLAGSPSISKHGLMGNAEVLVASDPTSADYSLPYIYDSFDWSHCEEDFASLML